MYRPPMPHYRSFRTIIDLWPSRVEFAADVGVDYECAKAWYYRDRIPGIYFVAIERAALMIHEPEITAELLSMIAARRCTARKAKKAA